MIEGFKIRKLDEGYTVKYYVLTPTSDNPHQAKYQGEKFCSDPANLKDCIVMLLDRFLEVEHK